MAVTHGHGNPDWTRDETILALHLYQELGGVVPGPKDPAILALSEELRSLPIHAPAARKESFRNPDGVAFKLQNLRQVGTGRGLSNASETDRSVWADFGEKPDEVRRLAASIRANALQGLVKGDAVAALPDAEELPEGRLLTAVWLGAALYRGGLSPQGAYCSRASAQRVLQPAPDPFAGVHQRGVLERRQAFQFHKQGSQLSRTSHSRFVSRPRSPSVACFTSSKKRCAGKSRTVVGASWSCMLLSYIHWEMSSCQQPPRPF